jgi:hypothetical protein
VFLGANNTKGHCQEWIKAYAMVPKVSRDPGAVDSPSSTDETASPTSEFLAKSRAKPTSRPCPEEGNEGVRAIQLVPVIPEVACMMAPVPLSLDGVFPSFGKLNMHTPCHLPELLLYWGFVSA